MSVASAQEPQRPTNPQEPRLPSAGEVLKHSAKQAGGLETYAKLKTIVMRGTFSIPKAGVRGTILTQYAAPNRARITVDLGKFGKTIQRINANGAWETSPSAGTRPLTPNETKRLLESISMKNTFEPQKVYASIIHKGREDVDGIACHRLELQRAGDKIPDQVFYSIETGLPSKTVTTRPAANQAMAISSRVSDYKDFGGLKIATKISQHIEATDTLYEIQITSVEVNQPLDDSLFLNPQPGKATSGK